MTKLCVPRTSFRDLLIWEMHAGDFVGHFGRDKTIALVEDRFYWPSLKRDVARIVAQCKTCSIAKVKKKKILAYILLYLSLMNLGKMLVWTLFLDCLGRVEDMIIFLLLLTYFLR